MDGPFVRNWALVQEDEETSETFYLPVLSGDEEDDWLHEWVDDIDGALLLPWREMVALAWRLKVGKHCEIVPVVDEE